jgi:hypothetical protein
LAAAEVHLEVSLHEPVPLSVTGHEERLLQILANVPHAPEPVLTHTMRSFWPGWEREREGRRVATRQLGRALAEEARALGALLRDAVDHEGRGRFGAGARGGCWFWGVFEWRGRGREIEREEEEVERFVLFSLLAAAERDAKEANTKPRPCARARARPFSASKQASCISLRCAKWRATRHFQSKKKEKDSKNLPTFLIVSVDGGGASQQHLLEPHLPVWEILKHVAGRAVLDSYVSRVMGVGTSSTFQVAVLCF